MVLDSLRDRMGGRSNLSPMQIAHNTLFTAQEKIDLLQQLKAELTSGDSQQAGPGADEIDAAIA